MCPKRRFSTLYELYAMCWTNAYSVSDDTVINSIHSLPSAKLADMLILCE